jgi:predicted MFS family arabinose efflux permease
MLAVVNGLLPVYISGKQAKQGNGAVMGLITMTFCIANVFAALLGGALLKWSPHMPLFASSILFLVASVLFKLWFVNEEARLTKKSEDTTEQEA